MGLRPREGWVLLVLAVSMWSCGRETPEGPAPAELDDGAAPVAGGTAGTATVAPAVHGTADEPNQPPTGQFVIHPNPPAGLVPLPVTINMCKSRDPEPDDQLRFTVDWGDGEKTRGSCRLAHVYERAGTYQAEACVSDRVLGNLPSCRRWTVGAGTEAPPAPAPTLFATRAFAAPVTYCATGPTFSGLDSLVGGAVPAAEAQSATRVVITHSVSSNGAATWRLGLGHLLPFPVQLYMAGAPNLGGQVGQFTYELTPGQFTGNVTSIAVEVGGPTCSPAAPCCVTLTSGTVGFYR